MQICKQGAALSVKEIVELAASNSGLIKSTVQSLLSSAVQEVEIDLGNTEFIDCAGAGALASLRREALNHNPRLRFSVRPPRPELRRVFTLTGLSNLFPAEPRPSPVSRLPEVPSAAVTPATAPVAPVVDILSAADAVQPPLS